MRQRYRSPALAQTQNARASAGCAICIEILPPQSAFPLGARCRKYFGAFFDAVELLPGQHPLTLRQILSTAHAAASVEPLQQRAGDRPAVNQLVQPRLAAAQFLSGFHADYLPPNCFYASRNSFISFGPRDNPAQQQPLLRTIAGVPLTPNQHAQRVGLAISISQDGWLNIFTASSHRQTLCCDLSHTKSLSCPALAGSARLHAGRPDNAR